MSLKQVAALREVPFKIEDEDRIPSKRYYDQDFYRAECEHLWPRVWQMACRVEQIPDLGDWVEYENLGLSVIVVRTRDGIKAFHNACRHRGVQLVSGHGNCRSQGFVCPFHGWRWNIDGKNTFVYGRHFFEPDNLNESDLALRSCRVDIELGCVFVNWDDDAPSLRECMGPLLESLNAWRVPDLRAEWWYATVLPANWKTAMEAFMEGYHVTRTHPQLQRAVPTLYNAMYGDDTGGLGAKADPKLSSRENVLSHFKQLELLHTGMNGMIHKKELAIAASLLDADLPDNPAEAVPLWYGMVQDKITSELRGRGEDVPDLREVVRSKPLGGVEYVFPHYFLLPPYFTGMSAYRVRPLSPETCLFELWSLTHYPPGEEPPAPMEPTMLAYDDGSFPEIPQQDYSNIPLQQKGLHAKGFDYMRLGGKIEGLISNYQRLIDGYIAGVDPHVLARAGHVFGRNFDGPIHDLGFET